jgi:hypothetical protein
MARGAQSARVNIGRSRLALYALLVVLAATGLGIGIGAAIRSGSSHNAPASGPVGVSGPLPPSPPPAVAVASAYSQAQDAISVLKSYAASGGEIAPTARADLGAVTQDASGGN